MGGKDVKEHDENLKKVQDRARKINLKLNPLKCKFQLSEVCYVGHVFTSERLKPVPSKIKAIAEMRVPENVTAL